MLPIVIIAYPLDVFLSKNLYRTSDQYGDALIVHEIYSGNINSEILIIGSSRAEAHFNAEFIENHTGKTTYNIGESGADWNLIQFRLEKYLKYNSNPKYLIINVDAAMFKKWVTDYKVRIHSLPYILYNFNYLKLYAVPVEDLTFPLVRYIGNRKLLLDILTLWKYDSIIPPTKTKGFLPVDKEFDNQPMERLRNNLDYSSLDIPPGLFYQFLEERLPETSIIGVHTPILIDSMTAWEKELLRREEFKEEFQKRGWIFLDYSFSPISRNINYFYNTTHMNYKGAERFTRTLMRDLDSMGVFSAK